MTIRRLVEIEREVLESAEGADRAIVSELVVAVRALLRRESAHEIDRFRLERELERWKERCRDAERRVLEAARGERRLDRGAEPPPPRSRMH